MRLSPGVRFHSPSFVSDLQSSSPSHVRLLQPSLALYGVVGLLATLAYFAVGVALLSFQFALFLFVFIAPTLLAIVEPICSACARRAELKQVGPGPWYDIDVEREKAFYGPLRANRLFGHPIGDEGRRQAGSGWNE